MNITKQMMKDFTGSYDEAIDMLLSVVNNKTNQDDIIESLEHHYIDNGLMSEEEFKQEVENE
jgi:tripartite-type tricarboxylate transporter receptor subunit TctC